MSRNLHIPAKGRPVRISSAYLQAVRELHTVEKKVPAKKIAKIRAIRLKSTHDLAISFTNPTASFQFRRAQDLHGGGIMEIVYACNTRHTYLDRWSWWRGGNGRMGLEQSCCCIRYAQDS